MKRSQIYCCRAIEFKPHKIAIRNSTHQGEFMKTIEVEHTGGPEVLHIRDIGGLEPPGPGQALVRILATGVNFMDIGQRRGSFPRRVPFTPGMEGAGIVESVGDDSNVVAPSGRVAFADQPGAYAEASLVSTDRLIPLPDDFSFEEGAAFPLQGMTAHYLIHEFRKPAPGDVVLIHAAAGGVGQLLVQWAHHLGAYVIGTVSSEEKAQVVLDDGANEVIIYTRNDFAHEVNQLTNNHGADLILDGVGKSTFRGNLEAVAICGHIVIFGASSGPSDQIEPNALMAKAISISGGSLARFISTRRDMMRRANDVMQAMRQGWLKLHIDRVLPLDQAEEAHRLIESRKTAGKIVLVSTAGQ
jgi:NADPH2:quinone reductase